MPGIVTRGAPSVLAPLRGPYSTGRRGNEYAEPAVADRWMYLEQDRDEAETAAFEARYRSAPQRMRAPGEQLTAVRAACSEAVGHAVDWDTPLTNSPAGAG
ncbi:DUF6584 family protein [Streptomyces massasporeus]|uniref:DUF6584 family protein n=1 Tax=Streptomyces massasporeus TaxID=67324 RepID=UPI003695A9B9